MDNIDNKIDEIIDKEIHNYCILNKNIGNLYLDRSSKSKIKKQEIREEVKLYLQAYRRLKRIFRQYEQKKFKDERKKLKGDRKNV